MSEVSEIRREWKRAEEQDRLFDAWNLRDDWQPPRLEVEWPEDLEAKFRETDLTKEKWGVFRVRNKLAEVMDGARIIHRGDAVVWVDGDASHQVCGDLDVAWGGRSPLFEVKAYLPACRQNKDHRPFPAAQGLDSHMTERYLKEQERTGRPFYVAWAWPAQLIKDDPRAVVIRGQRIDRLPLDLKDPTHNKVQKMRKIDQDYWTIESLLTLDEIVEDIEAWSGAPFQLALA